MNWISGKLYKKSLSKRACKKELLGTLLCVCVYMCMCVSVCMCVCPRTWALMQWGKSGGNLTEETSSWSAGVRREDSGIQGIGAEWIPCLPVHGIACVRAKTITSRQEIWPGPYLSSLWERPKFGAYKKNKMDLHDASLRRERRWDSARRPTPPHYLLPLGQEQLVQNVICISK